MKEVKIQIELDPMVSKIVLKSLLPELGETGSRTIVKISESKSGVLLNISADDSSALRAALNSYVRWMDCIISTATTFHPDN